MGQSCRYKRFFFSFGCSSRPSTKYFFLTVHNFDSFVTIVQQAGQAAGLDRLSLSMCIWFKHKIVVECHHFIIDQKAILFNWTKMDMYMRFLFCQQLDQRHMLRDRISSTTACPACWATGTIELKQCTVRKQILCTWPTEQPRLAKNILYRHSEPNKPTTEGPLSFCTP